jgi:alcohol oxidase
LNTTLSFVVVCPSAHLYLSYAKGFLGGSAACTAATRLSKASPLLQILVLEAGPHTNDVEAFVIPGQSFLHLLPSVANKAMSFYSAAKPSKHLAGRKIIVPAANCVGGGSSVNWMMYTRASASDYDDWEKVYGNKGWGYSDLLPLLRKV